jgi:hypothetical protein
MFKRHTIEFEDRIVILDLFLVVRNVGYAVRVDEHEGWFLACTTCGTYDAEAWGPSEEKALNALSDRISGGAERVS